MKINLEVENEKVIFPDFEILTDENYKKLIVIASKQISDNDKKKIISCIENNLFNLKIENDILKLKIDNICYCYNLSGYDISYENVHLLFEFLELNDKITKLNKKIIVIQ